jgi:predicted acylesterase/phospholipase RssA
MLSSKVMGSNKASNQPRVGLALAGGGPLGVIYQIGALLALDEALEGVDFHDLKVYVGVSAGAANASMLANGFTPAKMCKIFVSNESEAFPLDPGHFLRPAFRLYLQGIKSVPRLFSEAVWSFLRDPEDRTLVAALSKLALAIPPGLLDNEPIAKFLEVIFTSRGRTNDFSRLKRKLFVVAANLDTSEVVKFGARGSQHVPISKAVQASTAVPGLYPPVKIDGHYYIDGGIKKTVHASTALDEGADLLFCINPLVPFNARLAKPDSQRKLKTLVDGGLPVVMSQTFYALIYSRMKIGLAKYTAEYPDRDVILFEPNSGDTVMFFSNVFSFANRRNVCEHAYQTTRHDMLTRKNELAPLLARYGITLREDILKDKNLHFDSNLSVPPEVEKMGKLQNKVTNQLSDTLDQLSEWIDSQQQAAVSINRDDSSTTSNKNAINPNARFNQQPFVAHTRR